MKSLNYYRTLAAEMAAADRQRDEMLAAMDAMWQTRWNLPRRVAELGWLHKVVSTDPHDALRAGTRVLSSQRPRIRLTVVGGAARATRRADAVEQALTWHFHQASRRRRAAVLRDVALSALLYDEVTAQVVYLPHQSAALGGSLPPSARRYGPFALLVRNPRQVHVRYSDWQAEAVAFTRRLSTPEARAFWGPLAADLPEEGALHLTDYMDLTHRVVWAEPEDGGPAVEILRAEHGLPFLPWVAQVGGTTLADAPEHQRVPLLYSVYTANQWEIQNIVETLLTSEAIAYAAAPRLKVEGPTDSVEVDYGEPGRPAWVPPGHSLESLSPPGLDDGLAQIAERIGQRMAKSTVPRILQTAEFPQGTAFATLNLATESGIKALTPYKELAENALAEICYQMLAWATLASPPAAPSPGPRLDPADIDLAGTFIEVELTPDVPTDRMLRIQAAALAVEKLGYSKRRALEQIGETDPDAVLAEARAEVEGSKLEMATEKKDSEE